MGDWAHPLRCLSGAQVKGGLRYQGTERSRPVRYRQELRYNGGFLVGLPLPIDFEDLGPGQNDRMGGILRARYQVGAKGLSTEQTGKARLFESPAKRTRLR